MLRLNDSAIQEGKELADRILVEFSTCFPAMGSKAPEALVLEKHTQLEQFANWKAGYLIHVSLHVRACVW